MQVDVPVSSTATVSIPKDARDDGVHRARRRPDRLGERAFCGGNPGGHGRGTAGVTPGVMTGSFKDKRMIFEVGSGHYDFRLEWRVKRIASLSHRVIESFRMCQMSRPFDEFNSLRIRNETIITRYERRSITMKLVTYESAKQSRLGVVQGEAVVDVAAAYGLIAKGRIADAKVAAAAKCCASWAGRREDMIELLGLGERYRKALGVVVAPRRAGQKGSQGRAHSVGARPSCARPLRIPKKSLASGSTMPTTRAKEAWSRPRRRSSSSSRTTPSAGRAIPSSCPPIPTKVDYEAEFAVVIGKRGQAHCRKARRTNTLPATPSCMT